MSKTKHEEDIVSYVGCVEEFKILVETSIDDLFMIQL